MNYWYKMHISNLKPRDV